MKLICQQDKKEYLLEILNPYQHLDITLVELGLEYEGTCYCFSIEKIDKLIEYLDSLNEKYIIGYIEYRQYKINPIDIFYIEGFSKDAYIHTQEYQYRTTQKLYELEEKLKVFDIIRINKSMIVNIRYIDYVFPDVQSRYIAVLKNKEKLVITRNYVNAFKHKWKERVL